MSSAKLGDFVARLPGAVAPGAASMPIYGGVNVKARQMNPTVGGQEWLVLINPDNRRMMSTREVQIEVQSGRLARETFVWRAGMSAWATIGSIAELTVQNTRPTVPRARPPSGGDAPLDRTPRPVSAHEDAHFSRPTTLSPGLVLELFATGAAVLLIVLGTSYSLYVAGAFQPGSVVHGNLHAATRAANAVAH